MPYSLALCFKTREGQFRFAACGCSSFSTSAAVNNVLLCCADVLCLLLCAILFHLLAKTEFVLAVFYSNDCGLGSLWTHVVVVVVAQTLVHWSHQSCFSDPTFCSGLGLIGSKGSLMPALICQRGCGTWICLCWQSVYSPFHTSTNAYTSFFAIWFRAP
jgi:hypothetical protein